MKRIKFTKSIPILLFIVLLVIGTNYILNYLRIEKLLFFKNIDESLMSQEERILFKHIRSLIRNQSLREVNDIIDLSNENITVTSYLDKKTYKKGENINIKFVITNKSNKNLIFFPLEIDILSDPYSNNDLMMQDISMDFKISNAEYIKIIKPLESHIENFTIPASTFKENRLAVTLLSPKITEIERGRIMLSNKPIKRLNIDYFVE